MFENPEIAFKPGTVIPIGPKTVTKQEIIEFASEFDPMFFHLDEEAARSSMLGGHAASGFHTCCLAMRMICDAYLLESTSQGAPGVDECTWLMPVRPGDTLSGTSTVIESRVSKSKPELMIIKFEFLLKNQNGDTVLKMINPAMFRRAPEGTAA